MKKTDNKNLTPFGMLHKINSEINSDVKKKLYKKYSLLFMEFCNAFKGKNFINFSKGLKKKYDIAELTDKEIVDKEDLLKDLYGYFESPQWQEIKASRLRGFVIQNSELPWDDLMIKINEKINERGNNEKNKRQSYFKKVG